ncbi:spinster family MFS transporter [Pseudomonas mangrovi]|uniref:MFS transporter n=1 Tax=Pseudomonas mangrovi TaxID=2161748 RepID=A0A2T5P9B8_9PSED|nr:MFS transporter [Pseudomonas mangrovi]PTU74344.1 MFS transporter [Pseudomonas mangrovi]
MHNNNGYPSSTRAWLTVAILMLAYVLSFVDRQILTLLVGPIRADLQISDTQMSLLMGLSFALFYTICGIPLGRVADSKSRRGLIAAGVLVWSLMTALCGTAKTFWTFLTFRIGVGAGEAALSPSAYSLLADSFPPRLRATAISVYSMGIYLGSGLALMIGGTVAAWAQSKGNVDLPLLGETRPWQLIFLVLGAAGVIFVPILMLIKEPTRQGKGAGVAVPLGQVASYIRANRKSVMCHNVGFALLSFASYGGSAWIPEYFARTFGWERAEIGLIYGGMVCGSGALGILLGGRIADWLQKRGRRDAGMRVGILSAVIGFFLNGVYLVDNSTAVIALMTVKVFFVAMPFGVAAAAIQEIMPNQMRGQASAIYLFVITLIGMGIGPTAVAMVTQYGFRADEMLRYSICIVTGIALLGAAIVLSMGLKHYRKSLDDLEQWAPKDSPAVAT